MHAAHFWYTIAGMALFGLKVVAALWISLGVAILGFLLPLQLICVLLFNRNPAHALWLECQDSLDPRKSPF